MFLGFHHLLRWFLLQLLLGLCSAPQTSTVASRFTRVALGAAVLHGARTLVLYLVVLSRGRGVVRRAWRGAPGRLT